MWAWVMAFVRLHPFVGVLVYLCPVRSIQHIHNWNSYHTIHYIIYRRDSQMKQNSFLPFSSFLISFVFFWLIAMHDVPTRCERPKGSTTHNDTKRVFNLSSFSRQFVRFFSFVLGLDKRVRVPTKQTWLSRKTAPSRSVHNSAASLQNLKEAHNR